MVTRSSWARACVRLVLVLTAFLLWNALALSSASAQGQGSYRIFLYDTYPNPAYDVTSTYVNNHVTDRNNNIIYVTLNYTDGQVQDLATHVIGYLDQATTYQPPPPPSATTVPMSALALFTTGLLWRIR